MPEPQRLIFAPFLLDLRDERLWQENKAIRLGSKAFAILRCLVTYAGQLVTKDTRCRRSGLRPRSTRRS
jgi:DNA-binding winged helix-turn-helix (wHTH) protein